MDELQPSSTTERLRCINDDEESCRGPVVLRMALSGTGTPYPRCEHHWDQRLNLEDELRERYPTNPPSDWSPDDIGEHWYEED